MDETSLPLHAQFDIARLKLHLKEHPEQAEHIAIQQFTYHLELLEENQKLMELIDSLTNENSPLPSFLKRFLN